MVIALRLQTVLGMSRHCRTNIPNHVLIRPSLCIDIFAGHTNFQFVLVSLVNLSDRLGVGLRGLGYLQQQVWIYGHIKAHYVDVVTLLSIRHHPIFCTHTGHCWQPGQGYGRISCIPPSLSLCVPQTVTSLAPQAVTSCIPPSVTLCKCRYVYRQRCRYGYRRLCCHVIPPTVTVHSTHKLEVDSTQSTYPQQQSI